MKRYRHTTNGMVEYPSGHYVKHGETKALVNRIKELEAKVENLSKPAGGPYPLCRKDTCPKCKREDQDLFEMDGAIICECCFDEWADKAEADTTAEIKRQSEYPTTCSECGNGCWYTEPCANCEAKKEAELIELRAEVERLKMCCDKPNWNDWAAHDHWPEHCRCKNCNAIAYRNDPLAKHEPVPCRVAITPDSHTLEAIEELSSERISERVEQHKKDLGLK